MFDCCPKMSITIKSRDTARADGKYSKSVRRMRMINKWSFADFEGKLQLG